MQYLSELHVWSKYTVCFTVWIAWADLCLAFGWVIQSRGPQQEVALFPGFLAILLQIQNTLQVRHNDRGSTEVLLHPEIQNQTWRLQSFAYTHVIAYTFLQNTHWNDMRVRKLCRNFHVWIRLVKTCITWSRGFGYDVKYDTIAFLLINVFICIFRWHLSIISKLKPDAPPEAVLCLCLSCPLEISYPFSTNKNSVKEIGIHLILISIQQNFSN